MAHMTISRMMMNKSIILRLRALQKKERQSRQKAIVVRNRSRRQSSRRSTCYDDNNAKEDADYDDDFDESN